MKVIPCKECTTKECKGCIHNQDRLELIEYLGRIYHNVASGM
jgi:hypothetical protein